MQTYLNRNILITIAGAIFMAIIVMRAFIMPITHDEVATWFHYLPKNLFACVSNPECWNTANNHWLNSFLMQINAGMFGDKVWAMRIPNMIAGALYIIASGALSIRYLHTHIQQFAGFLLLMAHPYLLDFFSLARGYGMMTAGIMWGIYAMLRYQEAWNSKWLVASVISLILAVLSNFTALMPMAAIGASWFVWILIQRRNNLIFRHGLYWAGALLVLFPLLFFPIKTLAAQGEFKWGTTGVVATGIDLMVNLLYNKKYFGQHSAQVLFWFLTAFAFVIVLMSVIKKDVKVKKPILILGIMLLMNILLIIINKEITGAQTPVGRKSIYLIPFLFGLIAMGIGLAGKNWPGKMVGAIVSLVMAYHFVATLHIKSNREWYYDAYYPELFSVILPEGKDSDSIMLSSTWIFHPALLYYQKTVPLPLGGIPYERPLKIDSNMDYYYVEPQDTVGMSSGGFTFDTMIGPFYLYKNMNK